MKWGVLFVTALLWVHLGCCAKEEQRKCAMGRDYWLYTPEKIDKDKKYWLVVGVHGAGGNGKNAAGLKGWVEKYDNIIVIGPSFPTKGPYYQVLEANTDKQLLDIKADLSKEFKLYPRMFIHGFSGGSQYSHRFASKHPDALVGVSAHSGGSWSPVDKKAAPLVWTVSCGLKDTASSVPGAKPRIECYRIFVEEFLKTGFCAEPFVTEAGHSMNKDTWQHAEECFRVATTGLFDYQREATKGMGASEREAWIAKNSKTTTTAFNDGKTEHQLQTNQDGFTLHAEALARMRETRIMLDAEKAKHSRSETAEK